MDNVVDQEKWWKGCWNLWSVCWSWGMSTWLNRDKMTARVTKTVKDNEGNPRGIEHPTLFAYHSLYVISFSNFWTEELPANLIAENMLPQVDSEVHHYQILNDISDHSEDGSALNRSDGFIRSCSCNLHAKKKTIVWKLEFEWKDVTLSCI